MVTETRLVPVGELTPYPGNARLHDDEMLRESVGAHGQYRALVVQRSTGRILAGNGTYAALRAAGAAEVLVHFVDVDDDEARRINLVDNRSQERGEVDSEQLLAQLQELPDLGGTGYDLADLVALEQELRETAPAAAPQGGPPPEKAPVVSINVAVPEGLEVVEAALALAAKRVGGGWTNRSAALVEVCRHYLEEEDGEKGQLDRASEDSLTEEIRQALG